MTKVSVGLILLLLLCAPVFAQSPKIVAHVDLINHTSTIPAKALLTPPSGGLYRVSAYMYVTSYNQTGSSRVPPTLGGGLYKGKENPTVYSPANTQSQRANVGPSHRGRCRCGREARLPIPSLKTGKIMRRSTCLLRSSSYSNSINACAGVQLASRTAEDSSGETGCLEDDLGFDHSACWHGDDGPCAKSLKYDKETEFQVAFRPISRLKRDLPLGCE